MMNYVLGLNMMDYVLNMMDYALNMMDYVLNMMDCVALQSQPSMATG